MEMRSLTIGWSWLEPTAAREDDLANCDCPDVNALDVVMAVDSAAGRLTLCVSLLLMESWQSVDDRMSEMSAWCCFTLRSLGLKATTHHLHFNSRIPGESGLPGLPGSPWLSSSSCIRTEPFKVTGTSCSIGQIRFVSPNKWCQSTDWMQQQTSNCSHQFLPPRAAPHELNETYAASLNMAHWLHHLKTWRHPQNRKYTVYCIVITGGLSHGHRKCV